MKKTPRTFAEQLRLKQKWRGEPDLEEPAKKPVNSPTLDYEKIFGRPLTEDEKKMLDQLW